MFVHASRLPEYRTPFGAMPTDGRTELTFDADIDAANVTLCYTYGLYGLTYHEEPMSLIEEREDRKRYRTSLLMPHEPGLLFYWFRFDHDIRVEDEEEEYRKVTDYYVAEPDTAHGTGKVYFDPPRVGADEDKYPYAFQITVYDKEFRTPDVLKGAVIYQIFPDRFARSSDFRFLDLISASPREERIYHDDWDEDVDIHGKPSTGYLACDFFGGSLKGIEEKLDYIKNLGVDIIYLNPIFEARSSHRYDTADYLNVDPILGGNDAFMSLRGKADEYGIKIVLDGVFSHTGADSRYFNKFDRYPGTGAFRSFVTGEESMFRSWYNFWRDESDEPVYDSWWGFPDLPNVNEDDLSYRNFIFGRDGVVDTWTKRGIGGLRLDVSDELPDSFIRQMRDTLKSHTDGEGILIGEVWEDASNKCSYGSYRDFLLGRTHDSVMGYTFRTTVLEFLNGYIPAEIFHSRMEGFRERYPAEAFYCIMNLVSSHDVPRIMTMLAKPGDRQDRADQQKIKVPHEIYRETAHRSLMALSLQIGYIGACSVYYGDEILMEGYKDPFNRRTYPWDSLTVYQQRNLQKAVQILNLRRDNACLRTGYMDTLAADGDIYAIRRYLKDGRDFFGNEGRGSADIVLLLNRGSEPQCFRVSRTSVEEIDACSDDFSMVVYAASDGQTVYMPSSSATFIVFN